MNALALTDIHVLSGEPRVLDLRLGEALGFERPRAIRQLVWRALDRARGKLRSWSFPKHRHELPAEN